MVKYPAPGPLHALLEGLNCFLLPDVYCSESTSPTVNSCLGGVLPPDSDMWHKWSPSTKGGSICSDAKLAWYWRVSIRIHLVPLCPCLFMEIALKAISVTCPLQTSGLRHLKCSCLKQTRASTNLFLTLLPLHLLSSQKLPSQLGDSVKRFLIASTNLAYCLLPLICAENIHIPITNLKIPCKQLSLFMYQWANSKPFCKHKAVPLLSV